jgi:hypothetical protein
MSYDIKVCRKLFACAEQDSRIWVDFSFILKTTKRTT